MEVAKFRLYYNHVVDNWFLSKLGLLLCMQLFNARTKIFHGSFKIVFEKIERFR